jgi:hypothetical protein
MHSPSFGSALSKTPATRLAVNRSCIGFVWPKSPWFSSALSKHRHPGCSEPLLHWVRSAKVAVVRERALGTPAPGLQ